MTGAAVPRRRRASLLVAVFLIGVSVLVPGATSPAGAQAGEERGRVLVVAFPRLTWERLAEVRPPELMEFLDGAAVASTSPRTTGPRTRPAQAYLTIGAGSRSSAAGAGTAGLVAGVDEETPEGPAAAVFERRTGVRPDGEIVSLSFPAQVSRNERLLYGSEPGSLGQALRDAGIGMAAVGNAGISPIDQANREVALAAADATGQVVAGDVGADLLMEDPLAPFGVRADHDAHVRAVERAWERAGVALVEMSDLERAEQARAESTAAQGDAQFARALERADAIFGDLLATMDLERDLVVVVGPTAPLEDEQLTMFGVRGPGYERGTATSPTTRRAAYVTLTDLAPTVLRWLDVDVPDSMYVTPVTSTADDTPLGERIEAMERDSARAVFRDDAVGPLTVAFIVLLVVLLGAVTWFVARGRSDGPGLRVLRVASLTVLAVPPMMYLAGLLSYEPFSTQSFGLVVLAGAFVVALLAGRLRRVDPVLPPFAVTALCLGVLLVDVVTGEHLQINTVFGYSPIVAGRFAGFGNQAFALVGICSLIAATAGWDLWERRRPGGSRTPRTVALLALFVLVVALVGAPMWGSDVGGVLAAVPAFAVCTLLLLERRIHVRTAVTIGLGAVAMLSAFALVDLARPEESRTHLGRFVGKLLDGEASVILERKLGTNLSILTSTVWTFTIPLALLFFAYLTWRPNGLIRRIQVVHPSFRALGISGLTLGIVAFSLNDSGVALPAMMLGVVLPFTAYLALDVLRRTDVPAGEEASGDEGDEVAGEGAGTTDEPAATREVAAAERGSG